MKNITLKDRLFSVLKEFDAEQSADGADVLTTLLSVADFVATHTMEEIEIRNEDVKGELNDAVDHLSHVINLIDDAKGLVKHSLNGEEV